MSKGMILSFLFAFFIYTESVYAFFVPSSIQIASAAISNIMTYLIILAVAATVSLAKILKNQLYKNKRITSIISILIVIIGSLFILEYLNLRDLNVNSGQQDYLARILGSVETLDNEANMTYQFYDMTNDSQPKESMNFYFSKQMDEIKIKENIINMSNYFDSGKVCIIDNKKDSYECYNNCQNRLFACMENILRKALEFMDEDTLSNWANELNVNELSLDEINNFTTVSFVSQSELSRFSQIDIDHRISQIEIINRLNEMDFPEHEKLLFICYMGGSSKINSVIANLLGYDAYHMGFVDIESPGLIKIEDLEQINRDHSILINDFKRAKPRGRNVILELNISQDIAHHVDIERVYMNFDNGNFELSSEKKKYLLDSNILCTTRLSCTIIKYWLYDEDLSGEVSQIYSIE